jgi:hypothetical protein
MTVEATIDVPEGVGLTAKRGPEYYGVNSQIL